MDTELCNGSRCAIAWKRPGPGPGSSKPGQANPGLVKFFISISDPATNPSSNGENQQIQVQDLVAFVDYPRLILRNKLAGTFRLNPGWGWSGFEEPGPGKTRNSFRPLFEEPGSDKRATWPFGTYHTYPGKKSVVTVGRSPNVHH